jgi:hypothetical protein
MTTTYKPFGIRIDGSTSDEDWNKSKTTRIKEAYGDEESFEAAVIEQLDRIQKNQAGLMLFLTVHEIMNDGYTLTVVPYTDKDALKTGTCNAFPRADDEAGSHPDGQFWFVHPETDNPYENRDDRSKVKGTGKGSDVKLHFTPGIFASKDRTKRAPCDTGGGYGSASDVILFHEMVHSVRRMGAHQMAWPTEGKLLAYGNIEEFLAIVAANVYLSARKQDDQLRADHSAYTPLKAPLNTTAGFLAEPENLEILLKYYLNEVELYQNLSQVSEAEAKFNPFRELVWNGAKYRHPEIKPYHRGQLAPSPR